MNDKNWCPFLMRMRRHDDDDGNALHIASTALTSRLKVRCMAHGFNTAPNVETINQQ